MTSRRMLCRLCVSVSDDFKDLYDDENDCFKLTKKYFGSQLMDFDTFENEQKQSRVVCVTCWNHMRVFNNFQLEVQAAQINYQNFIKFEAIIKTELEVMFEPVTVMEAEMPEDPRDPVGLNEDINTVLHENDQNLTKSVFIVNKFAATAKKKTASVKSSARSRIKQNKFVTRKTNPKKTTDKINKDLNESENSAFNVKKKQERDDFIAENWKDNLTCGICGHVCLNFTEIKTHFRKLHKTSGYVTCCNRKFFHRIHLVDHLNVHTNAELFKCEQCGKSSASRRSLVAHIKNSHPVETPSRDFECPVCNRKFIRACYLRTHIETHATGSKDYVCEDCGKGFVLESRLKLHVKNVHTKLYNRVCELCGKSLQGKAALKRHLLTHEGISPEKWPCDQCGLQLVSKYSLKRHKQVSHSDNRTVYVCSICGKMTLSASALRSHKRYMHQGESKFKCNICQKAFKEHMSTHTGEDLYKCPHCTKTFRSSANMHHHRKRVHPKEWQENHKERKLTSKTDLSQVETEVIV